MEAFFIFSIPATVLFQGDSITDGNRTRDNDLNHVMGHGYAFLIASRLGADFPYPQLTFVNRGISGNRIVDLFARWQEDAIHIQPTIISILVGVNDTLRQFNDGSGVSASKYELVYRMLVQETKEALPDTTLVLCEPFLLPVLQAADNWEQWYAEISLRQEAVKRVAEASNSIYVPLQQIFFEAAKQAPASYWLWDGFHPTPAGHELIARQWITSVSQVIPS